MWRLSSNLLGRNPKGEARNCGVTDIGSEVKLQIERKSTISWIFPVLLISAMPTLAFALAGIAERTSFFHYNDFAQIQRGHPSDICSGATNWCLALRREGHQDFKGIRSTFEKLNIPSDGRSPYLVGQRSSDNFWLVYDLKQEEVIVSDASHQKVIDVWRSLGLPQPSYVNARNTRELLLETEKSVRFRWTRDLQMWLILGFIPLTPVALIFWYLSKKSRQKYEETELVGFRIFTYLFLAPVFIIIYSAISSFVQIIRQNW